jgi:hypothetical protein
MANEELFQAIELVKNNNKDKAYDILSNIVKREPRNELAWFWLSTCVEKVDHKIYCVNQVLEINPNNDAAKNALVTLQQLPQPTIDEIIPIKKDVRIGENSKKTKYPLPTALIIMVWIIFIISLFISNWLSFLLGIFNFIGIVFLLFNKNIVAKINGVIILLMWMFTYLLDTIIGLFKPF